MGTAGMNLAFTSGASDQGFHDRLFIFADHATG